MNNAHYVFGLLVAISLYSPLRAQPPGERPSALVVTAPVVERSVTEGQFFVGTIEPLQHAIIGSAVDGRVIEFYKREGERVEKGEALAQLLTETIEQDLAAAQAELDFRKSQLLELENGSRPEEIEQARARMAAAEANTKYTASRRRRNESVMKVTGTLSEDEYEQSVADDLSAQEMLAEARAAYDLMRAGPRQERIAQAAATVVQQEALVKKLADQIKKHTVIARFSGSVVTEHTEVGAWVKQGDPVAEVVAIDQVDIVAQVNEQAIPFVRLGDEVRIEVPALNRSDIPGKVAFIVPQADLRSRTFPVKIRVENQFVDEVPILKAGMYARAMLSTGAETTGLMVPKDAVVFGGSSPTIYVVGEAAPGSEGPMAAPVAVQLGVMSGPWIQVSGKVAKGQSVVIRGNERLQPRPQPVRIDSNRTAEQIDEAYAKSKERT